MVRREAFIVRERGMRRFIIGLFIISLCAVGGTWYWKTYYPEDKIVAMRTVPHSRGMERSLTDPNAHEMMAPRSSGRQDMAMTISILSSVISALAAVAQAWFARRPPMPPQA
jgi:hypothetical protein